MGMITGSGRVSLLSGRIQCHRVGLSLTGQIRLRYTVHAREWLGRGADRLSHVGHTRAGRLAGPSRIQPNKLGKIVNPFFFFKYVL
jgi:hypothetical protein